MTFSPPLLLPRHFFKKLQAWHLKVCTEGVSIQRKDGFLSEIAPLLKVNALIQPRYRQLNTSKNFTSVKKISLNWSSYCGSAG